MARVTLEKCIKKKSPNNLKNIPKVKTMDTSTNKMKSKEIAVQSESSNNNENTIKNFVLDFSKFQMSNNIGIISENMDPQKWLETDTFIYLYLLQIMKTGKTKDIIYEYGIANGFKTLFKFYKDDLGIDFLQSDTDILYYVSQQSETSINADIVLAIMRESIGFTPIKNS